MVFFVNFLVKNSGNVGKTDVSLRLLELKGVLLSL